MSFFKGNKRQLKILTLASKTQHEDGRYVLSFDVIKSSDYGRIKTKRGEENQVYEELRFITAPCSREIEMELKDKKCQFTFTVYGALEPASKLEKEEDVLEYNDSMSESRQLLHLTPTYDKASKGRATIKFWVGENVKHTVSICNVPVEKSVDVDDTIADAGSVRNATVRTSGFVGTLENVPVRESVGDTCNQKMPSSFLPRPSSDGSAFDSSQSAVDGENHTTVDAVSVRNATLRSSGPAMYPAENQAKPVTSMSTAGQGPTNVLATASAELDDDAEGATAYQKILTDASLQCLALGLSPQDSQKLLILLEVPSDIIEQQKKDHPGDIVMAMFHCLLFWKREKGKSVQLNQDTNKFLYEDLIAQLEAICRRDIKSVVMKALNANKGLEKGDFKHL